MDGWIDRSIDRIFVLRDARPCPGVRRETGTLRERGEGFPPPMGQGSYVYMHQHRAGGVNWRRLHRQPGAHVCVCVPMCACVAGACNVCMCECVCLYVVYCTPCLRASGWRHHARGGGDFPPNLDFLSSFPFADRARVSFMTQTRPYAPLARAHDSSVHYPHDP